jgi:hypothetical protein
MKKFRLISLFILASALLFSFTGCITLRTQINDIAEADVASIQIYELLPDERDSGFHKTIEPTVTLDSSQHGEFLEGLSKLKFSDTIPLFMPTTPDFRFGTYVVRLNFTDGSFRLISDAGYWEAYDTQGNYVSKDHYYGDDDDWYAFLKPYLPSPSDGKPSADPNTDTE